MRQGNGSMVDGGQVYSSDAVSTEMPSLKYIAGTLTS